MPTKQLKIGTAWVRGVVGFGLTPELIVNFSCAFGTWAEGGPIVIGRDTRRSSRMFRSAVIAGLLSPGCEVIDMGLCPTPLLSFAVRELGAAGGISITGGHNDLSWNSLKFIGPDGMLLNEVKSEELFDIYHASAFRQAPRDQLNPIREIAPDRFESIQLRYLELLQSALDVDLIRGQAFPIAVDYCSGSSAPLADRFLSLLGCTVFPLNAKPSELLPHMPAPTPENMASLAELVRNREVVLGAALNVDGDRIGFVTEEGAPLSEEFTLPLAALGRFQRRCGPVVTNLSTSRRIDVAAARHDQPVIRTGVGESFVMDRGLNEEAVLAGEGSGGVAVLPVSMTFDGLLVLGLVLEYLASSRQSVSSLVASFPEFHIRKGQVECPPAVAYRAVEAFRGHYASQDMNCEDGVRVEWEDSWLHVRASNTEPIVRVIVEADSGEKADRIFQENFGRLRRAVESS